MDAYVSRNMAYNFFEKFGNLKSVRLTQDTKGNLAWVQSDKEIYRISYRVGEFIEKSRKEAKGRFREIKYNSPLLYHGELYFYRHYNKTHPTNAWINRPEIISCGKMLKQLFSQKKNLELKLFAIRRKDTGLKLLNYLWALYEKGNMIFFIHAFQNGLKESNPEECGWHEIRMGESFYDTEGRKFFLHTEKEELCIRQIEA